MDSLETTEALPAPTQDERTFALLTHILAMFSGFLVPLIFFLVKRESRFVSFHALQVLIWHVIYMVVFFFGMIVVFLTMIPTMMSQTGGTHSQAPPPGFFYVFGFVWLFGMGGWIVNLILGIVYAIKANNGEWARYPILGDWALDWVLRNAPQNS